MGLGFWSLPINCVASNKYLPSLSPSVFTYVKWGLEYLPS